MTAWEMAHALMRQRDLPAECRGELIAAYLQYEVLPSMVMAGLDAEQIGGGRRG